jgi:hypothetical protein
MQRSATKCGFVEKMSLNFAMGKIHLQLIRPRFSNCFTLQIWKAIKTILITRFHHRNLQRIIHDMCRMSMRRCYTTLNIRLHCSLLFSSFSSHLHSSLHVFSTSLNIFTQNSVSFLRNRRREWIKREEFHYESTYYPMKATLKWLSTASLNSIYICSICTFQGDRTAYKDCLPLSLTSSEIGFNFTFTLHYTQGADGDDKLNILLSRKKLEILFSLPCYQSLEGF